jgi:tetratricopeptide (TPR) repeat protein
MDKYNEAIPCLNKALLLIEKMPHEDCNYLELIYGIGSCYNKLKQYEDAEKYFRRVIIRGNVQEFKCAITTRTLSELTEVYNKMGYGAIDTSLVDTEAFDALSESINSLKNAGEVWDELFNEIEKQGLNETELNRKINA